MNDDFPNPSNANYRTPSARVLADAHKEILSTWEKAVRVKIPSAKNLPRPLVIDTLPAFLGNLAEALSKDHPRRTATEMSNIPLEHGGERARLSHYTPDQLILEYQLLRDVILEKLESEIELTDEDIAAIKNSFDNAICDAMTAYFLIHGRIREQFTATLGHDLRNPIGAAQMAAELILLTIDGRDETQQKLDEVRKLAHQILSSMKRADRLTRNLLDSMVLQMGDRMKLTFGEHEILAIIGDALSDIRQDAQSQIQIKGHSQFGYWDGEAVRRAIENLLTNAVKYGDRSRPITVQVCSVLGRMIIQVHNWGIPIPIEEQEQLFQVFRRAAAAQAGNKRGWGIGLALVRAVAEAHGGSVGLESSVDRGTTFTFDIPIDARPFKDAPTT